MRVRIRASWAMIVIAFGALLLLFSIVDNHEREFRRALQQELALRSTFSKSDAAAIFVDRKQIVTFITPGFTKSFGYESRDLVGKDVRIIMPQSCAERHDSECPKVWEGARDAFSFTCDVLTKSGDIMEVSNTVLLFGGGGAISILTPYGKASSMELTIASLKGAKIGVWWWDTKLNRFIMDEAMLDLLCFPPEKRVATFEEFLTHFDKPSQDEIFDVVSKTRESHEMFRVSARTSGEKAKWTRIIGRMFHDGNKLMGTGISFETSEPLDRKFAP